MIKERYIKLCIYISYISYFHLTIFGLPSSPNVWKDNLLWSGIMLFGTLFLASSFYLLYIIEANKKAKIIKS